MTIRQTEIAIKQIKDYFERGLAEALNLVRVSAPLFVLPHTGLNDNLNGVDRPVSFDIKCIKGENAEIVQSLAKWKRYALKRYGFGLGEGLYTDMNAIRRDEDDLDDSIHSLYVDQWDWELIIGKSERTLDTLYACVRKIFGVFKSTEQYICGLYPSLQAFLPDDIYIIDSNELEELYPHLSSKERENEICKAHGAVFVKGIGGVKHDGRSPDYDDWDMNGDILFWYPPLNRAVEFSSMGVRVDEQSMLSQLTYANALDRKSLMYHSMVLDGQLPYTIGGGLGQSRICMFFLNKSHIGEVHASVWSEETIRECEAKGINLL
jgi:aspartate--ammonia ligase